jgi:adenosylcobyric acid synthase
MNVRSCSHSSCPRASWSSSALDQLDDRIEEHADTAALWRLIELGPPDGLGLLPPGAR